MTIGRGIISTHISEFISYITYYLTYNNYHTILYYTKHKFGYTFLLAANKVHPKKAPTVNVPNPTSWAKNLVSRSL